MHKQQLIFLRLCLNHHEKWYDLYPKVKLIIYTNCLNNYNISNIVILKGV